MQNAKPEVFIYLQGRNWKSSFVVYVMKTKQSVLFENYIK